MQKHVRDFLETLQLTEKGLPEDYLQLGLSTFYADGENTNKIVRHFARRIIELSELPALPKLARIDAFDALKSFFSRRAGEGDERIAVGPFGTNVVYAVGTRAMLGEPAAAKYGEKAEEWRPCEDTPVPIGLLTQTALSKARQREAEYCPIPAKSPITPITRSARRSRCSAIACNRETVLSRTCCGSPRAWLKRDAKSAFLRSTTPRGRRSSFGTACAIRASRR